jgi:hypothetical protein
MAARERRIAPRRGLDLVDAAGFVGVGVNKFRDLVARGLMPRPKLIDDRRVWDVDALDIYFSALPEDDRADSARTPQGRQNRTDPRPDGIPWK